MGCEHENIKVGSTNLRLMHRKGKGESRCNAFGRRERVGPIGIGSYEGKEDGFPDDQKSNEEAKDTGHAGHAARCGKSQRQGVYTKVWKKFYTGSKGRSKVDSENGQKQLRTRETKETDL